MKKRKQPPMPPRWADKLLEWFVAPHLLEFIQGDLHESFYRKVSRTSVWKAKMNYVRQVLHCLTPFFFKRKNRASSHQFNHYPKPRFTDMLSNFFTIAFRNLWRHKAFTTINVTGLASGLATCILIMLFVVHELSYDRYYANADRIYRVVLHGKMDGKAIDLAYTSEPAGVALQQNCPGVESMARLRDDGDFLVKNEKETFKEEKIAFVDSNFLSFFSIPMLKGDRTGALAEPKTLVLTETAAQKYFGGTDPIGKSLSIGHLGLFRVTGICKDVPSNTHFQYQMFGSFQSVNQGTSWLASGAFTYIMLRPGYPIGQVDAIAKGFINRYIGNEVKNIFGITLSEFIRNGNEFGFRFQPVSSIHLYSDLGDELEANGDVKYVYVFSAIALFILLLACINFMNLSTAGSAGRSKEVGMRKVLGSVRSQLVGQFLTESVLLTLFALAFALGLVLLLLPQFNDLSGKQFLPSAVLNWRIALITIPVCLLIGLLAGSYPAFVLSSFRPIAVLRGKMQTGISTGSFRNVLVTIQFVVSITMIIVTIIANQQLRFMQNKRVGFDKEQVLVLHDTHVLGSKLETFKNKLSALTPVVKVTFAGFLPAGSTQNSIDGIQVRNGANIVTHRTKSYDIDENYLSALGIGLAQGRNFSKDFKNESASVLINETAAKAYGFRNPIGQQISTTGDGSADTKRIYTIVGVVKDFHFENMHQSIAPLVMFYGGNKAQLAIRIQTDNLQGLLSTIEKAWKAETDNPFLYSFMDERFNKMYESEKRIGQLFGVFAGLTVLIACLGLFGLAALTTHQRTREIGVRKVLGASVAGIVSLLLSNYIRLIFIAIVIASPIAGYAMSQWLHEFAYKVEVSWWVFALAGLLAIGIAVMTVSYQAIKAALMDPVKSLRTE